MQAELFRSQEEKKFILIRETERHRPSNVRVMPVGAGEGGIKKKRESQFSQESFFLTE